MLGAVVIVSIAPMIPSARAEDAVQAATRPDFDGDGYADLAIGTPGDGTEPSKYGTVTVLYGGVAGLTPDPTLWSQATAGISGEAEGGDAFGTWVSFGVPGEEGAQGAMQVLYGSAAGLTATATSCSASPGPALPRRVIVWVVAERGQR